MTSSAVSRIATTRVLTKSRLPQPSTRTRTRREIVVRAASTADTPSCTLLDGTYTTTHIWQLDTRQDAEEVRTSFRLLRLPRELTLIAPHRPPTLPATGQRRGLLWLVAEEVEIGGMTGTANREPASTPDALPAWSHAVRPGRGTSSVQLSLPRSAGSAGTNSVENRGAVRRRGADLSRAAAGESPAIPGQIVGYVAVACAPRDDTAYLRTLVVDRAHRRKGIGAQLLVEAKRWAAGQGAARLMADTSARNYPALRLLQKAGFAFCGFNDCCYSDQEVAVFFSTRLR